MLEKKLQGRGLRLLYSVAWPGQGIYTKDPLKSVDDLKGKKIRTYSPLTARLAELLGASPTHDPGARGAADVRHRRDAAR